MREIKFRAWIEKFRPFGEEENDAHMSESFSFQHFDEDYFVPEGCYLRNMNIMQYTGLKDKNGKEIYEGDIIEHTIYRFAVPNITPLDRTTYWDETITDDWMSMSDVDWEIIGNIYENPELLSSN